MSEVTALTVPPAGWYPDRNEANVLRWWDGQQWTDQTQSSAPAAEAFEQPVSVSAFGFVPPEQNPLAQATVAQATVAPTHDIPPGWYPDNADPSMQRWWDGTAWTTHTAASVATHAQSAGVASAPYLAAAAPAVNSMATRGMVYSLIGLVLNPFAMMSIGGLVLGIRALRRAPQFAVTAARRGQAIAAIVVGSFGTVATILLLIAAITTAVAGAQRNSIHAFDREGAERHLMSELSATNVSCPPDPAMKPGDRFDCTATLDDGRTIPVHITIEVDGGVYTYSWRANPGQANPGSSTDSSLFQADHAAASVPYSLEVIKQNTADDFLGHYGVNVTRIDCDPGAAVARGDFFQCTVAMADGRTAGVQIAMSSGTDGGYTMLVLDPPAGGSPTQPAAPTDGAASDPDVSNS